MRPKAERRNVGAAEHHGGPTQFSISNGEVRCAQPTPGNQDRQRAALIRVMAGDN